MKKGTDLPKGANFLADIPELADLRIEMSEQQFNEIVARQKNLNVTSPPLDLSSENQGACHYEVKTLRGEVVFVMFKDGTCSGIQRMKNEAPQEPENSDWGDPSDGVQLRIHSPEVQQDRGKWKVQLKTDIRANKERVLPNYGAPIDAYVIQWNGKWYRPANDDANLAASMKPSNATQRDSMHTVINAAGWIEESTGKPMSALSPGQHELRIALPLRDGPKGEAKKPQRAVSNEIEVEIVAVQPDHAPQPNVGNTNEGVSKLNERIWGPEKNGFQLGLRLTNVPKDGQWRAGAKLTYKLWIRNSSDKSQLATDFLFPNKRESFYPELKDEKGQRVFLATPAHSGHVQSRDRTLAAGEVAEVGEASVKLRKDMKSQTYSIEQVYKIRNSNEEDLSLSVSSKLQVRSSAEVAEEVASAKLNEVNPDLRWDRLQPNNEHARVLREWDKIPYEKASAAGISKTSELSQIWEEVPPGSKSFEIRKDVRILSAGWSITIYHRPDQNRFWVQRDALGSSFMTYFGPFDGDPSEVLDVELEIRVDPEAENLRDKTTDTNTDTDPAAASSVELSARETAAHSIKQLAESKNESNGDKTVGKDEALPDQIESGWKSVTIDEWQELFEFRVNKNQSVFGTKTFKSDANLAIGTFLDIGTVANEHGFTHLRVIQTTPAKQFPRLNIAIQAAEKGIGEMFVVEFDNKKPADSDDVMEVASLVKIAGPDRFEKKKKSHELSEKMKARYGNWYAVYEMHPNDLRKGKRIHLGAYLTKGKVKKLLGSTSLGPESYRDHSRLAVAIVDGKAVIERWGSEGYTGNAWDLKDDLNKECQALNGETNWPGFRVKNKGTSQEIARNNNGWKLMVECWRFKPKGAKKATEKSAEPQ